MSTAVLMERIAETSPRFKARIAGILYLLVFVAAPFAEFFVRGGLLYLATPRLQRPISWRTAVVPFGFRR